MGDEDLRRDMGGDAHDHAVVAIRETGGMLLTVPP